MSGYGPNPDRRGTGGCVAVVAALCLIVLCVAVAVAFTWLAFR